MQLKFSIAADSTRCSTCMLGDICLPLGMSQTEVDKLDSLVTERIRVPKGMALFKMDDPVVAVYGVRSGSLKTQIQDASGQIQITGFRLPGEIVGMDGLDEQRQLSEAVALEDTEVCVIGVDNMDALAIHLPILQRRFRRLMSQEITRSHQMLLSVGTLRSEQRLAAFLLNLSQRMAALGYSPKEFMLRMTREEIGNYLGLTLETVSRLFSRFARESLIRVKQREVYIIDMPALRALSGSDCG